MAAQVLPVIAFYLFAGVAIAAGFMVTVARNPVRSVLWLILAFFSAAGLFVLIGAEFVAMLLLIVYVGAVAVLFLFVVMMLDVDFAELRAGMAEYLPLGALIGIILLIEIAFAVGVGFASEGAKAIAVDPAPGGVENTRALGLLLYDDYALLFQLAGLILLVAMIGAIVLTLRTRDGVKKQSVVAQMHRTREESVALVTVKPGEGVGGQTGTTPAE
ncbi:MAG: NADH-quinone oxidoreductase subunit J [Neomegalonema sp.]|nr:NADH-quinone oxidoreductase subunit J [Neomegalonema sp.]